LPEWIQFNPERGVFSGTPPAGFEGDISIRLTARDSEGRQVVTTFRIKVGEAKRQGFLPGKDSLTAQLTGVRPGIKLAANDPLRGHLRAAVHPRA